MKERLLAMGLHRFDFIEEKAVPFAQVSLALLSMLQVSDLDDQSFGCLSLLMVIVDPQLRRTRSAFNEAWLSIIPCLIPLTRHSLCQIRRPFG
jgi:hypothetical protein